MEGIEVGDTLKEGDGLGWLDGFEVQTPGLMFNLFRDSMDLTISKASYAPSASLHLK